MDSEQFSNLKQSVSLRVKDLLKEHLEGKAASLRDAERQVKQMVSPAVEQLWRNLQGQGWIAAPGQAFQLSREQTIFLLEQEKQTQQFLMRQMEQASRALQASPALLNFSSLEESVQAKYDLASPLWEGKDLTQAQKQELFAQVENDLVIGLVENHQKEDLLYQDMCTALSSQVKGELEWARRPFVLQPIQQNFSPDFEIFDTDLDTDLSVKLVLEKSLAESRQMLMVKEQEIRQCVQTWRDQQQIGALPLFPEQSAEYEHQLADFLDSETQEIWPDRLISLSSLANDTQAALSKFFLPSSLSKQEKQEQTSKTANKLIVGLVKNHKQLQQTYQEINQRLRRDAQTELNQITQSNTLHQTAPVASSSSVEGLGTPSNLFPPLNAISSRAPSRVGGPVNTTSGATRQEQVIDVLDRILALRVRDAIGGSLKNTIAKHLQEKRPDLNLSGDQLSHFAKEVNQQIPAVHEAVKNALKRHTDPLAPQVVQNWQGAWVDGTATSVAEMVWQGARNQNSNLLGNTVNAMLQDEIYLSAIKQQVDLKLDGWLQNTGSVERPPRSR